MTCRKCKRQIDDDSIFCKWCGTKQEIKKGRRQRPNGTGSATRRGKTWTAIYIAGYSATDGNLHEDRITLGGFPTKSAALDYIPVLKASAKIEKASRNAALTASRKEPSIAAALSSVENYCRRSVADEITFKALYDRWAPFYEPRIDKSTMNGHKAALSYFRELWDVPFAQLSADDLQDCIDDCPRGRRTQENMKSLAKRLYEYAIGRKIVPTDYASYIYIARDGNRRREAMKKEHVEMIRAEIGRFRFAEYVYCLCYLGFRPNEMLSLEKTAYHNENGVEYLIGGFKTDAGTDRAVTIAPQIAPIIRKLVSVPGLYIFPGPGGEKIDDEYLREKVFYPLLDSLGIQSIPKEGERAKYVPYSCRHYFADMLKVAKGTDKDKAALMGHSDYETTKRIYQSEDLLSMQKITNSFS